MDDDVKLTKIMDGIWLVSENIDLNYSPDDKGYYLANYNTDKVSQVFPSKRTALLALKNNKINWNE